MWRFFNVLERLDTSITLHKMEKKRARGLLESLTRRISDSSNIASISYAV